MKRNLDSRIQTLRTEAERRRSAAAASKGMRLEDVIAPCYLDLHKDILSGGHTFYNLPGGRGSGKSSFVALEIVSGIMNDKTKCSSAIVFRRIAGTMRDSVFAQVAWAIDVLEVSHLWKAQISPMLFEFLPTGQQILFRGLDDPGKLKSLKARKGFFKYLWFEEFSELPGTNFSRNVLQSVMRGSQNGFICFRSFNPPLSRNHWANQFVAMPDDRSVTLHTDYTMLPEEWLGFDFLAEAEHLKQVNLRLYENEYLGLACGSGGEVFNSLEIREIEQSEIDGFTNFYCGCDFGFSADPAAVVFMAYDRKHEKVYFLDEIVEKGLSNKALYERIVAKNLHMSPILHYDPFTGKERPVKQLIICDSAEPKSIDDLSTLGLKTAECLKYAGSVNYGIRWLQARYLVIDPKRTPKVYKEFTSYEYERSRDGELLSSLPDRDNHTIDACRYGLDNVIHSARYSA